jgi:hypothetical protein
MVCVLLLIVMMFGVMLALVEWMQYLDVDEHGKMEDVQKDRKLSEYMPEGVSCPFAKPDQLLSN